MAATELLQQLRADGFTVDVQGENLHVAPACRLTDSLRAAIQAEKPALMAALRPAPGQAIPAARNVTRHARLLRWGWAAADAEHLSERLDRRDRECDARVMCVECCHYWPDRCRASARAGLDTSEVGPDMATLLQRCNGFAPRE